MKKISIFGQKRVFAHEVISESSGLGVNPAAATSLLGAATSVGASFSADTSTSSSVAQGARASKLRVLAPWIA